LESRHGTNFRIEHGNENAEIAWGVLGKHNASNAMVAIAAANSLGIPLAQLTEALKTFKNVKRRLEVRGCVNKITVYDDFAHHPTAIEATIHGLRQHVKEGRIFAVLHLASNSMRMGIYQNTLGAALKEADIVIVLKPENTDALNWVEQCEHSVIILDSIQAIVAKIIPMLKPQDHVLVMSNGNFEGIHEKILSGLLDSQ
jgi:UDP-N-acetylmuramate: L-alanyl-gamma-D-glutamyl-meso-diaminopimelate ligase